MSHIVLLVSHPFLEWKNGADLAALQLARQLRSRGHTCTLELLLLDVEPAYGAWRERFGGPPGDAFAIGDIPARVHRLAVPEGATPRELAEQCARIVDATLAVALAAPRPDVVLVPWGAVPLAQAACAHHDRVVMWIQNVEALDAIDRETTQGLALATVSPDLARRIQQRTGHAPLVILNPIERDGVVPTGGPRDRIGMVNFCAEKGAVVLLNVAANLPAHRFVGTGGWGGPAADYTAMRTNLANVEITPPFERMAEFYAGVRVLVVPSLWREAFGRVVIEAAMAGIPVVCTSRCGARDWAGELVIPVRDRPADMPIERYYHDAELHRATITGFLDALVTLDDPANHALASEQALAAAARYADDQRASIDRFERWLTSRSQSRTS